MKTSLKCCISMVSWECAPAVSAARPKPPAIFPPISFPLTLLSSPLHPPTHFVSIDAPDGRKRGREGRGGHQEGEGPPLEVARQGLIVIGRAFLSLSLSLSPLTLADCTLLPTSTHSALLSSPLALFLCFF